MSSKQIEEFAKILVREVRDAAIRDCDSDCGPESQSIVAKRWRLAGGSDARSVGRVLIPDCIDTALYFLLRAIDQDALRLQFVAADGKVVELSREGMGELAGWLLGPEGWRDTYSEERRFAFVDMENEADEPQA